RRLMANSWFVSMRAREERAVGGGARSCASLRAACSWYLSQLCCDEGGREGPPLKESRAGARGVFGGARLATLIHQNLVVHLDTPIGQRFGTALLGPAVEQLRPFGALVFAHQLGLALGEVGEVRLLALLEPHDGVAAGDLNRTGELTRFEL